MSRFSDSEGEKRQRLWSTARWLLGGALGLSVSFYSPRAFPTKRPKRLKPMALWF
jgi:hypothetical protein